MKHLTKFVALDVGMARIGVATCDPLGLTVRPLTVIQRTSRNRDFAKLVEIVKEEEADAIVCGLPLNMDGSEGSQAKSTRKWAKRFAYALRALLGHPIPLLFWDERLSTFTAQKIMITDGDSYLSHHSNTASEDAVAAAVILRSYLDAQKQEDKRDFGQILLS
ncbi:Holliday junction resolvase RuvX [Chloroflexi bacterium TSY]|nr:Holliday junction resolvase RuvX [Chloroflexi bacterium TSY]